MLRPGLPCPSRTALDTQDSGHSVTTIPPPPILKTWRRLYAAVLLFLSLEVVLFYALTRSFF